MSDPWTEFKREVICVGASDEIELTKVLREALSTITEQQQQMIHFHFSSISTGHRQDRWLSVLVEYSWWEVE